MSTDRTFQDMLDDYVPERVIVEEVVKRDYLLSNIERDDNWTGAGGAGGQGATPNAEYIVKFKGAQASSVSYGALTVDTDIAEDKFVRGRISAQKEIWGTLQFKYRDLLENKKISEQKFLDILPESIEDFSDYFKGVISVNLLNGDHFAHFDADGTVGGTAVTDRPDRFVINQKVFFLDSDTPATSGYVSAINMETRVVTFTAARDGAGGAVDLSAYSLAAGAKFYNVGAQVAGTAFLNLRSALLSLANGGDATLHAQTKTAFPYLQAINVSGADILATNILEKLFDFMTTVRTFGKGAPKTLLMSLKNYGSAIKNVENKKGSFNVVPDSQKSSDFGWDEIVIGSVYKGALKLVAVHEMDNDIIIALDWRSLKFASNGFIQKVKSPDGLEYFVKRSTTGYVFIMDICLFGELVVKIPSYCGILYGVSY